MKDNQLKKSDYTLTPDSPEGWYAYEYPRAAMTTDQVIFGFDGQQLYVLLVQRGVEPYFGRWAFPGGFMQMDETLRECAERELKEETGVSGIYMEEFGTFSDVNRDPRGRVVSTGYYALMRKCEVVGGDDAQRADWFPINEIPALAFDHDMILRKARQRLREDLHFRPIGFELLPEEFTIPQLQRLYESILNVHFDRRNFQKKLLATNILIDLGRREADVKHKAASLYKFDKEQYELLKKDGSFRLEF